MGGNWEYCAEKKFKTGGGNSYKKGGGLHVCLTKKKWYVESGKRLTEITIQLWSPKSNLSPPKQILMGLHWKYYFVNYQAYAAAT